MQVEYSKDLQWKGAVEGTSRKVLDAWTAFVRNYGMGGLLWGKVQPDGTITGPLNKAIESDTIRAQVLDALGAAGGDIIVLGAGAEKHVNPGMGVFECISPKSGS